MSRENRLPILPTRGALVALNVRIAAALKGHRLLKRKADALLLRFRSTLYKLIEAKGVLIDAFAEALFSLAEVRFVTGETIGPAILGSVESEARTRVRSWKENVAGVGVTIYQCYQDGVDPYEYAGLARGGQQLAIAKQKFFDAAKLAVELASLQSGFATIDHALKATTARVAAIEHIVIPKFENTLSYLSSELDELDREDFYRVKKLLSKKYEDQTNAQRGRKGENRGQLDDFSLRQLDKHYVESFTPDFGLVQRCSCR